ncbi:MAG: UvrD-helicase domain-containing protein [Bacteroidia bacterium]|nr:UvrD-helicase domain-containing protein [Bacteroidia bacterium]
MNYLDNLNEAQRAAVCQTEGPVMIVAGAGSGKTRVLTYRIAYMLQNNIDAFNILALTFTNKASKEMRNRIYSVVGSEARNLWMGTFHSVFSRILRIESERLGYPKNFTIYDADDAKSLIKSIITELKLDDKLYKPSLILGRISAAKNALIKAAEYNGNPENSAYDQSAGRPQMGKIYSIYEQRCFKAGAMDFDDLLVKTHELLHNHPDILNKYQHQFKYIMVDEFQDTNYAQYAIVKLLSNVYQNIAVVGDDAQSIYAFRGATIKNILNFHKDFPDTKVYKLEENYRSTQNIVNVANSIIKKNRDQIEKKVFTQNEAGERIRVFRALTDNEEGKMVASAIFQEKMNNHLKNEDFAILYRTNAQSRSIEEALRKMNMPYKIYGGLSFYQRKEIKDLLAYFRVVINTNDEEALKRIINYPARGIGKTSLEHLAVIANQHNKSWFEIMENVESYGLKASKPLSEFVIMIKSFQTLLAKPAYEIAMHIAKQTGLLKSLYEDKTVEGIARYENIEQLLNGIKEFSIEEAVDDDAVLRGNTLPDYMQDIALLTDADNEKEEDRDKITLMTIHGSKGLEFKYVYIVGMEENLFPSQMSLSSRQDLEEERRLFYVALTRAEKKITLSFATSRFKFGTISSCEPSRFLTEIDPKYILFEGLHGNATTQTEQRKPYQMSSYSRYSGTANANKTATNSTSSKPLVPPKNFKPINKAIPQTQSTTTSDFVGDDTSNLQVGMLVEHQRFGNGTVVSIEGNGDNKKANIDFGNQGKKMLVLKFAKLKINR